MTISKSATALLCIAAIVALASASLSKTIPAGLKPSPSDVTSAKGSQSDPGFEPVQLGSNLNFRDLPLPAALGFNPFDDAAPMKYTLREYRARE